MPITEKSAVLEQVAERLNVRGGWCGGYWYSHKEVTATNPIPREGERVGHLELHSVRLHATPPNAVEGEHGEQTAIHLLATHGQRERVRTGCRAMRERGHRAMTGTGLHAGPPSAVDGSVAVSGVGAGRAVESAMQ